MPSVPVFHFPAAFRALSLVCACWAITACGPGFFAQEVVQSPVQLPPPAVVEEPAPISSYSAGLGCSPKGCLMDAGPSSASPGDVRSATPWRRGSAAENRVFVPPANHPLRGKGKEEIERLVRNDLPSLGSMSFGQVTRGGLINAVYLPDDARWTSADPIHAWGTAETIDYLVSAIDAMHAEFPDSHSLFIGDISRQRGGYLTPHLSHQAGKDVDVGYFYTQNPQWYLRATPSNLDRPRTWALIRAMFVHTDVQYIFMDRRIQRLVRSYAEAIGEDPGWLESVFDGVPGERAMIMHEPGHDTHFHVRFFNPIADETARRCYSALVAQKKMLPMRYNIAHKVKRGETLSGLAKRYKTTVATIMRANGMRKSLIKIGKAYFIPQTGSVGPAGPVPLPPRRIPPPRRSSGPLATLAP
jgi:penicillin-insensitive murein endopeptidase